MKRRSRSRPELPWTASPSIQWVLNQLRLASLLMDFSHARQALQRRKLFTDTGSRFILITSDMYSEEMGKVFPAKYRLRALGSKKRLDVKRMVRATISTKKGASTRSWIYEVGPASLHYLKIHSRSRPEVPWTVFSYQSTPASPTIPWVQNQTEGTSRQQANKRKKRESYFMLVVELGTVILIYNTHVFCLFYLSRLLVNRF